MRQTCTVSREFGVVKAARSRYDIPKPVGMLHDSLTGGEGTIILLMKGCGFTEEEVLSAYNTLGLPPVTDCATLTKEEFSFVKQHGYPALIAKKIKGLIR